MSVPADQFQPGVPMLLAHVQAEWQAHTQRHQVGGGWGTFRSLASVLQVAATVVLAFGVLGQFLSATSTLNPTHVFHRIVPSSRDLAMLALVAVPEWLEVLFFGKADRVLRACGVVKTVGARWHPSRPPALTSLHALWVGQMVSRLTNLAVHVVLAVLLSAAIFGAMRNNLTGTPVDSAAPTQPISRDSRFDSPGSAP